MKKKVLLVVLSVLFLCQLGTVNAAQKVDLRNSDVWSSDFPNIPTDSTNAMNIAQPFLLFSRNLNINNSQMIDGNVATQNLNTYGSFLRGTTGVSYIQNNINNTASWLHVNQTRKFVFGSTFKIVNVNNTMQIESAPSNLKQLINNVSQSQLYQDTATSKYLDFDQVFTQLTSNAQVMLSQAKQLIKPKITEDPWYWPRITIDTTQVPIAANGTKTISLSARDLNGRKQVNLQGLGDAQKVVLAINTDGTSTIDFKSIRFNDEYNNSVQLPIMFAFSNTASAYTGNLNVDMIDASNAPVRSILAPQATVNFEGSSYHGNVAAQTINYNSGQLYSDKNVLFSTDNTPETGSLSWLANNFDVSFGKLKANGSHFSSDGQMVDNLSNLYGAFSGTMQVKDTRNIASSVQQPFYITLSWTQPFTSVATQAQLTQTTLNIPVKIGKKRTNIILRPKETIQVPSDGSANSKDVYMFKVKNDATNGVKTLYNAGRENQLAFNNWNLDIGAQEQPISMGTYTAGFTWTLSPSKLTSKVN